jgi:DNA-binding transcriptional LysR family regulator
VSELARRGTIAEVARALAYTPSAVSQQLSALEREAGVALLERSGRRVLLTPTAHTLVAHAEAVLERLERAEADLALARAEVAGILRIGAFPTAGRAVLPSAIAALVAAHPSLEPTVREIDPAAVAEALRAGDLDVALVHAYDFVPEPPDPAIGAERVFQESMYLAAPRAWPGSAEAGDTGDQPMRRWRAAPWIIAPPTTSCGAMTLRACQAAGFNPRARHLVDDFSTVLALVAIEQGVALIPELAFDSPPSNVALHRLPMRRTTLAAYRRGAERHPSVRAFISALQRAAPKIQ